MAEHELRTWPEFFEAIVAGRKTYELRENDRGFAVGDTLLLREYDPREPAYTGREYRVLVKYMTLGPMWGLSPLHCCMGIAPLDTGDKNG